MTIYTTGTVSVTNGDAVVTGSGTAWAVALIAGGMFSSAGMSVPILSVDSDTSLTLAYDWPGTTATGSVYAIARENSEAADIVDLNDKLSRVLVTLSLAGITPNGSGTIAERDALTLAVGDKGFLFLHAELGYDFEFYRWSGSAWEGPYATRGPAGLGTGGTIEGLVHAAASKATPVDADELALVDSAASFGLKKLTWANLKARLVSTALTWSGVQTFSAKPLLSGGAISFPATQVPSAGANDLDDYEEGTWTPTLTFATPGDLAVTYVQQIGRYTKIGRLVMMEVVIQTNTFTWTTASGNLNIGGMPFVPANNVGGGAMDFGGITKAGYTQFVWNVGAGTSILRIEAVGSGAARLNVTAADMPSGSQKVIQGYLIYAA